MEINVDYFYIPYNEFNFDKSPILVEKISEINTCYGILINHFYTGDLKKKDYFTMFKLNDYMLDRDMEEELYTNLLLLLKLIFKNKENLKNKASEYSKYTDFNLSNYKDTNILKTNHFSFYDLLEIHNLFQILQKWDTLNIENENMLKIMFGFQEKPQSINDNNIKEYKNIYTNDNSKISKPLTSIDLNNDENKFDFYTYQFSRDLKISSYFFNSGIEYAESEIKEIAGSLLKYMNNKEMTTKNVTDFFFYEKISAINLITDIFSNKSNLLDKSLVLQKKRGSDSIFEIVGYDLNLNLKYSVNNAFADSDYDNFIIQKLRGYLNNFNNIFEYIKKNYNIGNLNLIILDAYLHNVVILKTDLNNKINEDKSIDLKINYTLDLFNLPFKDYKLNSKSLRIKLLKISDFVEKKYSFTDKIIQKKIDNIWNKISILMENSDLSLEEKEELKKLKQKEEKFNFHHGKFIEELKNFPLDEEISGFDYFNLQIILLKNIFNNSNKFKEFIDEIISGIDYTPEEFRESHYFYVNPKFLNYKKTKIKNNELYFDFLIEHSIADTVTKELEIYILKTKSKPLKNFEEFKKDRCKNNKLDGSVTWVDNEIFNSWSCIDYEKYGICKDGRVIDEGNKLLDLSTNFGTLTADQACCVCGGGTDEAELIKPVEGKNIIKLKVEDVSIHEMTEKHKETLIDEIVEEFNTVSEVIITRARVELLSGSIIIIITLPETKSQTETIKIVEKANSIEINIPTRVGVVTSKPKVEIDSKLNLV